MNVKQLISDLTGYWIHKKSTLPIGADLFLDLQKLFNYNSIKIIFDVGANAGQTTLWIRQHLKHSLIYCFEPVKGVFQQLKINTSHVANLQYECLAFGDKQDEVRIRLHKDYSVLNSLKKELMNLDKDAAEETIIIHTIDDYCKINKIKNIDLLKIDTEGYEMNVLKGAINMLTEGQIAFVLCEVGFLRSNIRNTYFADVCEYLSEYGYYFQGFYQICGHSWDSKNVFGNALFVSKRYFKYN